MKKLLHSLLVAFFATTALVGCSKEEEAEPTTALELTITDDTGTPVSGATVKLYTSQTNWKEKTNQFGTSQTSDAKGKVTFKDLEAIKYFWLVEKDCLNNVHGAMTTTTSITANKLNTSTAVLSSTGTLTFTNNSSNPYEVYINGELAFIAEGGESYSTGYAPTGSYSFRVLQKSGYAVYPTDKTYTGTVACGGTLDVTFPNN